MTPNRKVPATEASAAAEQRAELSACRAIYIDIHTHTLYGGGCVRADTHLHRLSGGLIATAG